MNAVTGTRSEAEAAAFLVGRGIASLQALAGYTPLLTEAPLLETIESYWRNYPYAQKDYAIRFVGALVNTWLLDNFGSIPPQDWNALEQRIYLLIESETK